ncbi:acetylserotonin O-methyltransferase isoform X3 [Ictidomys tridecemlineatus]
MGSALDPAFRLLQEHAHGFMVSQVLFAACELGLFDLLAEAPGPLDVAAISEGLGASPRGTELLLEACVPLRLLDVDTRGGTARYANSELARAYLTSRSPTGQRAMLRYLGSTTYRCWAHLADAVRWAGLSRPPGGAGAGVMTPGGGAGAGGQQGSCPRCAPGCGGPGALQRGKLSLCPDAGHRRAAPEKQWSALQGDRRVRGQDEGTGHLWVLPRMLTMSQGEDTFLLLRQGSNQYLRAFGVPAGDLFAAIYRSPAERLQFTRGLQEIWSVDGRRVLTAFDLSPFRTVCDLGGGAGALAQQCASLYPGCRVTVFEVPEVVQTARAHLPLPTEGQVGFREGDFFADPLPEADLYILARVLHDWSDETCSRLLASVHHACRPGGGVLVVERVLDADGRGPLAALLGSLNMLLQAEGRERTAAQFRALLAAAGFGGFALRRTGGVHDAILATKALPEAGHPGARGQ